jgi:hypothetical protein
MIGGQGKKLTGFQPKGGAFIFRWLLRSAAALRCTAWTTYTVLVHNLFNDADGENSQSGRASFNRPKPVCPAFRSMETGFLDCWKHPPEERRK